MFKAIAVGLIAVGAAVISWMKRREARARMRRLEAGGSCLSCDSSDVVREEAGIRCQACGYLTSNELLDVHVSDDELTALNEVEAKRPW